MHFTRTRNERHTGAELCCDTCNKQPEEIDGKWSGWYWWYVRYNSRDRNPSMWVCNECKEDLS